MKFLFLISLSILWLSCTNNRVESRKWNNLKVGDDGFSFSLEQRKQIEIPSDSNNVFCSIEDITKGQTLLTITEKSDVIFVKSIRPSTVTDFSFHGKFYKLECESLINKAIGKDIGFFRMVRDSENYRELKDETAEIQKLIQMVATSDIVFIRNGTEHSAKEAADHLKKKWEYTDGKVKTVNAFIQNLATKSSITGEVYKVKLKNGKIRSAEDWFNEQRDKL